LVEDQKVVPVAHEAVNALSGHAALVWTSARVSQTLRQAS
jgi:hypothetical protein